MNLQKIKDFIYNNIVYFAIYNTLFTIGLFVYSFFGNITFESIKILEYFKVDFLQLSYFKTDLFEISSSFNTITSILGFTEIFVPLFYVILIIGIVLYFVSKKREQRLLQFCMSIMFISNFITIVILLVVIIGVLINLGASKLLGDYFFTIFFQFFKLLFTIVVCFVYLRVSKKRVAFETLPDDMTDMVYLKDGKREIKFVRVKRGTRFVHYIIDAILMVLIFSPILMTFLRKFVIGIQYKIGEELTIYLVALVSGLLYYGIFEGFFRTTPAKYITDSAVAGYVSEKVNGSQILGRTFSRKIPFEAFSFFGELGWHDQLTETVVAHYEADKKYKPIVAGIIIAAAVVILVVLIANLL